MLAYVFWHWRRPDVDADRYEAAQRAFHDVLAAEPSAGFRGSFSHALSGAPWANAGGEAYEDWYLVDGSAALDPLNTAAVTAARQAPHDAAAALAAGGTAGLYRLRIGAVERGPAVAHWFAKPAGVSYPQFLAMLEGPVQAARGALFMRQMTLGPTAECVLLAPEPASLPPAIEALTLRLRPVVAVHAPARVSAPAGI
jgi:hypothetical protein